MFDDPATARLLRDTRVLEAQQRRRSRPVRRDRGTLGDVLPGWHRTETPLAATHELFAGMDRRALRRLARRFLIVDVDPGDSLGRQGETASEFVVVLAGRIGVSLDGLPIAVFDEGSHFGALPLIDGGPDRFQRASFDVLEHSRVAIADRIQFEAIMESFPIVADRITRIADVRRAYLAGDADAKALALDRDAHPFPVHLARTG